ncbi:hypothetical protein SAMN05444285_102258 [Draconibacterium orientale]|uniref:Lacal_2735 family protein n=1 Tax=Draconibacterium orientale TaxID=1168034 RepID=A0A1H9ZSR2_9BACT|nr:Lacal_2735 family protein [Draconibacterium orientale]SES84699.1 hypothetical protein SAMN05444285_102258 [Draconibacterium orientale]
MFGLFKKDSVKALHKKYDKLTEEAFLLSCTNRRLSDQKYAEAEAVQQEINALRSVK